MRLVHDLASFHNLTVEEAERRLHNDLFTQDDLDRARGDVTRTQVAEIGERLRQSQAQLGDLPRHILQAIRDSDRRGRES